MNGIPKRWNAPRISNRKVGLLYKTFFESPLSRRRWTHTPVNELKALLAQKLVAHSRGADFYLTPKGQYALWAQRGTAKPWEMQTRSEKDSWRKRLISVALQMEVSPSVRHAIISPKRKLKNYNRHAMVTLRHLETQLNMDIVHLHEGLSRVRDLALSQHIIETIRRKRNLRTVLEGIVSELDYGEIDLTDNP